MVDPLGQLLPWQQDLWQDLMSRAQGAGLPHASLLLGAEGVGKRRLARRLAQYLLCLDAHKTQAPCGHCQSCQLMASGSHPDYRVYDQEARGKQIKVDAIRGLNDFLATTPQIAKAQVVQIYPLEAMNVNASNALLKTLEEPAGNSYLLLLAERLGPVLPTIRSRTQRINVNAPAEAEGLAWLQAETGCSSDDGREALQQCFQAPLKAVDWMANDQGGHNAQCFSLMQAWLSPQLPFDAPAQELQAVSKAMQKYELTALLSWWFDLGLDLLKLSLNANDTQIKHQRQLAWLKPLAAIVDRVKLLTLQQKLQHTMAHMAAGQGSYNSLLLIETTLLDWRAAAR